MVSFWKKVLWLKKERVSLKNHDLFPVKYGRLYTHFNTCFFLLKWEERWLNWIEHKPAMAHLRSHPTSLLCDPKLRQWWNRVAFRCEGRGGKWRLAEILSTRVRPQIHLLFHKLPTHHFLFFFVFSGINNRHLLSYTLEAWSLRSGMSAGLVPPTHHFSIFLSQSWNLPCCLWTFFSTG